MSVRTPDCPAWCIGDHEAADTRTPTLWVRMHASASDWPAPEDAPPDPGVAAEVTLSRMDHWSIDGGARWSIGTTAVALTVRGALLPLYNHAAAAVLMRITDAAQPHLSLAIEAAAAVAWPVVKETDVPRG